ncbi:hypothetical protein ACLKA6_007269 [Drosophila palustris]
MYLMGPYSGIQASRRPQFYPNSFSFHFLPPHTASVLVCLPVCQSAQTPSTSPALVSVLARCWPNAWLNQAHGRQQRSTIEPLAPAEAAEAAAAAAFDFRLNSPYMMEEFDFEATKNGNRRNPATSPYIEGTEAAGVEAES